MKKNNTDDINQFNLNLKTQVLSWVNTLRVYPNKMCFYFGEKLDYNLFSSCFALFIYDLYKITESFSPDEVKAWINYIHKHQDAESGYFIPRGYKGEKNSKTLMQLTTFCLSSLSILKSKPKYKLKFIEQWNNEKKLKDYLFYKGCLNGIPGSGNFAMFLGIFFTYKYEAEGDNKYLILMDKWFEFHNEIQNQNDGFWGKDSLSNIYIRFQNSFHQFVIYEYWNKPLNYCNTIIDNVLNIQDSKGHFAPWPGGGGCYDYDAVHILIRFGLERNYKTSVIELALDKNLKALLNNQNSDGGFCESRETSNSVFDVFNKENLSFIINGKSFDIRYQRLRTTLSISRQLNRKIYNHWSEKPKYWEQSDIWNTWFRCLTIAEIYSIIHEKNKFYRFQPSIGIGYNNQYNKG